jgi:catechol 2,3-dioxygenase
MVQVPKTSWPLPFRVTRASHLTYNVGDLSRSREFYTQVLGLVVSDEDRDTLYLRGVEERSHHSLVLKRSSAAPACIRTGLRTYDEEDLEKAKVFFASRGLPAEFVDAPYQSRTLHTFDSSGTPLARQLAHTRGRRDQVDPVRTRVPSVCGTADRDGSTRVS